MKQLLIVKPGTVNAKDKEKLTKNGYILIEHPFPGDVRVITELEAVNGNDILMAAFRAINAYGGATVKAEFFNEFYKSIKTNVPPDKKQ